MNRQTGPDDTQIEACRTIGHAVAVARETYVMQQMKAGQKQRHCATCDRWKFAAERCPLYRRTKPGRK